MINLQKATPSGGLPMMLPGFPLENQRTATDQTFPAMSLNSGPNPAGFQVLGTANNAVPPVSDPRFIDSKYILIRFLPVRIDR